MKIGRRGAARPAGPALCHYPKPKRLFSLDDLSPSEYTTMKRGGFTLIELLIVIVIIGILAAIAMPKLGKTRERGYFKAMNADLRNLATQQEIYFSQPQNMTYAGNTSAMANFVTSPGVTATISEAAPTGWGATASHTGLQLSQTCAVFYGTVSTLPTPATTAGVVTCTGE